eukprot:TRINITY_DN5188_c0_g2_i1.p1 TRINITY_DN5188_c0_g2~~TRINITY_DN5188_c0_g2_i1.p1  ORF type:complete len:1559 (+),score=417.71 TRINITY_DN5188_c0_g2_i1:75-4751(+)
MDPELPAEVPAENEVQFHALMKQQPASIRGMLKDASLPLNGEKRALVVRLVRHLAGLQPTDADAPLFAAMKPKRETSGQPAGGRSRGSGGGGKDKKKIVIGGEAIEKKAKKEKKEKKDKSEKKKKKEKKEKKETEKAESEDDEKSQDEEDVVAGETAMEAEEKKAEENRADEEMDESNQEDEGSCEQQKHIDAKRQTVVVEGIEPESKKARHDDTTLGTEEKKLKAATEKLETEDKTEEGKTAENEWKEEDWQGEAWNEEDWKEDEWKDEDWKDGDWTDKGNQKDLAAASLSDDAPLFQLCANVGDEASSDSSDDNSEDLAAIAKKKLDEKLAADEAKRAALEAERQALEPMEGEGEAGALVVNLAAGIAERLLADDRRWCRHYEAVVGAALEVSFDEEAAARAKAATQQAEEEMKKRIAQAGVVLQRFQTKTDEAVQQATAAASQLERQRKTVKFAEEAGVGKETLMAGRRRITVLESELEAAEKAMDLAKGQLVEATAQHDHSVAESRKAGELEGDAAIARKKKVEELEDAAWTTAMVGTASATSGFFGDQEVSMSPSSLSLAPRVGKPSQPLPLREGAFVTICCLPRRPRRILNGRAGRVLKKNGDVWTVRLASGEDEDFESHNLETRLVKHGEAWVRQSRSSAAAVPVGTFDAARAERLLHVLSACLLSCNLPAAGAQILPPDALCILVPPEAVRRIRGMDAVKIMGDCNVIAAVAPVSPDASEDRVNGGGIDVFGADDHALEEEETDPSNLIPGLVVQAEMLGAQARLHSGVPMAWHDAEIMCVDAAGVRIRWCLDGVEEVVLPYRLRCNSHPPAVRLLIFGEDRSQSLAWLRAASCIERFVPGALSSSPPCVCGGEVGGDVIEPACSSWRGLTCIRSPVPSGGFAADNAAKRLKQAAAFTDCLIERVGPCIFLAGPSSIRRCGSAMLDMLSAGNAAVDGVVAKLPRDLEAVCTRLRVPDAVGSLTNDLRKIVQSDQEIVSFWIAPDKEKEIRLDTGAYVVARSIKYGDQWFNARVIKVETARKMVVIRWDMSKTKMRVRLDMVKAKLSPKETKNDALKRLGLSDEIYDAEAYNDDWEVVQRRREWLRAPWTLLIFGPTNRQRKEAAVRAMACTEKLCPGLWSAELAEALDELRDVAGADDVTSVSERVGVEARSVTADVSLEWAKKEGGRTALRRAGVAAGCNGYLVADGLFVVGTKDECARLLDYYRWLLASQRTEVEASKKPVKIKTSMHDDDWDLDWYQKEEKKKAAKLAEKKEIRAVWESRAARLDVIAISSTRGQNIWLEPSELRKVERDTSTVILVDHGFSGGGDSEWAALLAQAGAKASVGKQQDAQTWDKLLKKRKKEGKDDQRWRPLAMNSVYVCGHDENCRSSAAARIKKMLVDIPLEDGEGDEEAIAKAAEAKRKRFEWDGGKIMGGGAADAAAAKKAADEAAAAEKALKEAEAAAAAEAARVAAKAEEERKKKEEEDRLAEAARAPPPYQGAPVDSRTKLRDLAQWPEDTKVWESLQDVIWAGHQKLKPGWIRVWSRSKDCEYYYRLSDGKTSFSLRDAM